MGKSIFDAQHGLRRIVMFEYDETSKKTLSEQMAEYNDRILAEQPAPEKTQIEIMQETLDMVVLSMLGGEGNV